VPVDGRISMSPLILMPWARCIVARYLICVFQGRYDLLFAILALPRCPA
jgi:hypothetical protein